MQRFLDQGQQTNLFFEQFLQFSGNPGVFEDSWATDFKRDVVDKIDEEIFSPLYSENPASRPSASAAQLVGAIILKEERGLSYEGLERELQGNWNYRVALGLDLTFRLPFTGRTIRNFKRALIDYQEKTGEDLLERCYRDLSDRQARAMGANMSRKRMDSFLIESEARNLSRRELFYETIRHALGAARKALGESLTLPERLEHYLEENDINRVIYRAPEDFPLEVLVEEATLALGFCSLHGGEDLGEDYLNLRRLIEEQTLEEEGKVRARKDKSEGLNSQTMQTPMDPDATYREKAGKAHQGYVANVVEVREDEFRTGLIIEADFQKNTYSDPQFALDYLGKMKNSDRLKEDLVVDGAYPSEEVIALAESKGVRVVPTNLPGLPTDPIHALMEFDEEGKVTHCPAGHVPESSNVQKDGTASFSLPIETCAECPNRDQCHPKINQKAKSPRVARVRTSRRAKRRATMAEAMSGEEAYELACFRNGVEVVPSQMRSKYNIDRSRVYGYQQNRQRFFFKIMAANSSRMRRWRKKFRESAMDNCAQK